LFELVWTDKAKETYNLLKNNASQKNRYKAVKKTLTFLASNPRHNSLQTHQYESLRGPDGEKVFEAYAQQRTPAAYRVFWYYGPDRKDENSKRIPVITVFAITSHP